MILVTGLLLLLLLLLQQQLLLLLLLLFYTACCTLVRMKVTGCAQSFEPFLRVN